MSAKELFSDKKDGSLSKKTESALEFCCRCWCRTKNICSIYHSIKMAGIVHFPPLQLESVCCFSKKKKQNITVRPEERISLNLKLWDGPVGEFLFIPLSVFHHFGCHCSVGRLINIDLNSKNKYCIGNTSSTEHECNNKPLQTAGVLSRAPGWRHILYILTCIWYLPDARVKRKLFLRSECSLCSLGKRCENLWGATCAVITDVSH